MSKTLTIAQRREVRAFLTEVVTNPQRKLRIPEESLYRRIGKPDYAGLIPGGWKGTSEQWFAASRDIREAWTLTLNAWAVNGRQKRER